MLKYMGYLHQKVYEKGILKPYKLTKPVISIGNLNLGGTGKTPFVMYLAGLLKEAGKNVVVLSRGYKGSFSNSGALVSDGKKVFLNASEAGDEPYLMAQNLDNVPLFVGKKRWKNALKAEKQFQPDCFILDDGYQHHQIHADIKILLINALKPFQFLREPISGIERASLILITNSNYLSEDDKKEIYKKIRKYNANVQVYESEFVPVDGSRFKDKNVFIFCGIARPQRFLKMLEDCGANIVGREFFRDHYAYKNRDIKRIQSLAHGKNADMILTTEKDFVRIKEGKDLISVVKIKTIVHDSKNTFLSNFSEILH